MNRLTKELTLRTDPFTGETLGAYELICRLSTGGMAEIFLAVRKGEGGFRRLVVLKRILPAGAREEDFVKRLLEEGRLMGNFSHPHIAQVFDVGKDGEEFFLVMEYVAGVTLLELLRCASEAGERLPVALTVAVGRTAAQALHHAHSFVDGSGKPHPVIHRDIAPKNIMLTFEGDLKLLDFGVAKTPAHLTNVGTLMGTPAYMSPEQAQLQQMDPRSDVFSLSATLHECLTGRRLFGGASLAEEIQAVVHREIPAPSSINPEVAPALDQVILRGLARAREDRFATALDFARALETSTESWPPDRVVAVVQAFFPKRQGQTRALLQSVRDGLSPTEIIARSTVSSIAPPSDAPPTVMERSPPAADATAVVEARPAGWGRRGALIGAVVVGLALLGFPLWTMLRSADPPAPPVLAEATQPPVFSPPPTPPPAIVSPPPPAPPVTTPVHLEPAPSPRPPVAPTPRPPVAHHRNLEEPRAAAGTGTLWVKVRPWARVFVDGKLRGETPLDPFSLSAGHHSVRLVNDQLNRQRSMDVEVKPNEQREVGVVLDD